MPDLEDFPSGESEKVGWPLLDFGIPWCLGGLFLWFRFLQTTYFRTHPAILLAKIFARMENSLVMGEADLKKTTFLEMNEPADLRPKRVQMAGLEIRRVEALAPEFHWFLHQAVGAAFRWGGREDWGLEEWMAYIDRPGLETWVAWVKGAPAGYFVIEKREDGSVEITNLGLLARHFGQGLGGHLLTETVERAWDIGANRVWLHTCTHDHEHALANYLARGFKIFREQDDPANLPRESALFSRPKFA